MASPTLSSVYTPGRERPGEEADDASPVKAGGVGKWVAYRRRWGVLALYAAASGMGALVWNILVRANVPPPARGAHPPLQAPVYAVAEQRFDRGPQAINSLANVRARRALRARSRA